MWLHDRIAVGDRVQRTDNPRHTGRVDAMFGTASNAPVDAATYRVTWDNGWREDCAREELTKET